MAFALPLLMILLTGIVSYGGWFFSAHNLQQAANDGARAAIAGLSPDDRANIAQTAVSTSLRRTHSLDPQRVSVLVDDDGQSVVVRVTYDAASDPMLSFRLLPLPGKTIERSATALLSAG